VLAIFKPKEGERGCGVMVKGEGRGSDADGRRLWHTAVGRGRQPEDDGVGSHTGQAGEEIEKEKGASGGGCGPTHKMGHSW
jgi:hypothetical protein